MRKTYLVSAAVTVIIGVAAVALLNAEPTAAQPAPQAGTSDLRPVGDFAGISDQRARAIALFQEAGKVLLHPRCVNCHPAGDNPHQTDRMRLHQPMVVRGADGHGAPTLPCNTCHGPTNFDPCERPRPSRMALGPALDGVGRPVSRPDLRADQGPRA